MKNLPFFFQTLVFDRFLAMLDLSVRFYNNMGAVITFENIPFENLSTFWGVKKSVIQLR